MLGAAVIHHSDPQHLNPPIFQHFRFPVIQLGCFQVDVECMSGIVRHGTNVVWQEFHVAVSVEFHPYVPVPIHDADPVVFESYGCPIVFHVKYGAVLRFGGNGLSLLQSPKPTLTVFIWFQGFCLRSVIIKQGRTALQVIHQQSVRYNRLQQTVRIQSLVFLLPGSHTGNISCVCGWIAFSCQPSLEHGLPVPISGW